MTLARLLRCQPWGTSGLDFVPKSLPAKARWYLPWRYGRWRGVGCQPSGTSGFDFVPETLPAKARWYLPWRYGRWLGVDDRPRAHA